MSLWATGFGPLAQSCATGGVNAPMPVNLAAGASAVVNGGLNPPIAILYAGGAPGLPCGVVQLNLRVPDGTPSGNFGVYPWADLDMGNLHTGVQTFIGATIVVR